MMTWKKLKFYRYKLIPESGRQKGLTLMLDGHNDIVADSSVADDFQASIQAPISLRIPHQCVGNIKNTN